MPSEHQDTPGRRRAGGGISMQTLLIASVASAVTSYVVSRVWGPGTIIGAAASPVLVALIAESLRKPVQTVSATARRVPVVVQPVPAGRRRPGARPDGEDPPPVDPGYVATLEADETARTAARPGPRWGLVLATAAAAFAIVVAIYTIPDLVAGKSIIGNGRATTLFGGHRSSGSSPKRTTTDGQGTTSTRTDGGAKTQTTTTTKTVTTTAPATTPTTPAPTSTATPPTTAPPTTTTTPSTTPTTPTAPTTPTTPTTP